MRGNVKKLKEEWEERREPKERLVLVLKYFRGSIKFKRSIEWLKKMLKKNGILRHQYLLISWFVWSSIVILTILFNFLILFLYIMKGTKWVKHNIFLLAESHCELGKNDCTRNSWGGKEQNLFQSKWQVLSSESYMWRGNDENLGEALYTEYSSVEI